MFFTVWYGVVWLTSFCSRAKGNRVAQQCTEPKTERPLNVKSKNLKILMSFFPQWTKLTGFFFCSTVEVALFFIYL